MISVKANNSRLQLLQLCCAILICEMSLAPVLGQGDPYGSMPEQPPYANDDMDMTLYNESVQIDVLANDYQMSYAIDPTTVQVLSGPISGTVVVDPQLGLIEYTPNQDFAGYDDFEYTVKDVMGNESNVAYVSIWVDNMPPTITLSHFEEEDDVWAFYGTVTDESPETCLVTFGGLLEGQTAIPDENGDYILYVSLSNGEEGAVTAQTTDEVGEDSNIAEDYLIRY